MLNKILPFANNTKLTDVLTDRNNLKTNQEEIIWESDQQHVF